VSEVVSHMRLVAISNLMSVYDRFVDSVRASVQGVDSRNSLMPIAQRHLGSPNVERLELLWNYLFEEDEQMRWRHSELVGLLWDHLTDSNIDTRDMVERHYKKVRADMNRPRTITRLHTAESIYKSICGPFLARISVGQWLICQPQANLSIYLSCTDLSRLWIDTMNPLFAIPEVDERTMGYACVLHAFCLRGYLVGDEDPLKSREVKHQAP
jgi:hypothetical protein